MLLLRDTIDVKKKSRDATFGNETAGATIRSKANVQKSTRQALAKMGYGENGKVLESNMLIFVPKSLDIEMGDRVIIISSSVAYFNSDKEWEVRSVSNVGGISAHHKEVLV